MVITDLKLPGLNGLELVRQLHAAQPRLPIILVTAFGTTETAIEAMKFGAYDYLLKPFDIPQLLELVRKAADSNRLMSEPVGLGRNRRRRATPSSARAQAMQDIYKEIGRVATKPVNVLIRGETGTGKELIARAIYQHSDRANAPFIAINCAAIPETLLESELFGHERGAFTGADARRIGRFEQADHGTIFLDEIGDMTPGTQVKLMRVLQEKTPATARRQGNHCGGRARCRRHPPRPGNRHPGETISRRPVLPPQRGGRSHCRPCASAGRTFPTWSAIFCANTARNLGNAEPVHPSRRDGIPPGAILAGQRARAGKCRCAKPCSWRKVTPSTSTTSATALNKNSGDGIFRDRVPLASTWTTCWPRPGGAN